MGRLYLDGHIRRVLIVAPSSVCAVWQHELQQYADFPYRLAVLQGDHDQRKAKLERLLASTPNEPEPLRVAVINYESTWRLERELIKYAPDFALCDESQRIKNHSARQSKAMHKLGDVAKYKLILTGTPVTQDTRDLWSQYRFLDPAIFGKSFYTFQKRYAVMGGYGQHQYLGPRNLEELTRKAHSIAYRVTKDECLDLPDKLFEERAVELDADTHALYRKMLKESYLALDSGGEVTASIVLTRLLRLQQITGGFITTDDGKTRQVSTAKLEAAREIAETLCIDEGKKLVIFARFRAEISALQTIIDELLRPAGLRLVTIDGSVPIAKRGEIVNQFQTDPDTRVLIGQIEACAEGVTLTAASTMVYYSLTYTLAKYLQSQDRIHRIGQGQKCLYIHLICPGTVDTKIMSALNRKHDLAKSVVDNWRALFTDDEGSDST